MSSYRPVSDVLKAQPVTEGAGVHLMRVFGHAELSRFDPFLLLDDFRGDDPALYERGFPMHPHRGIETITYIYVLANQDGCASMKPDCARGNLWRDRSSNEVQPNRQAVPF